MRNQRPPDAIEMRDLHTGAVQRAAAPAHDQSFALPKVLGRPTSTDANCNVPSRGPQLSRPIIIGRPEPPPQVVAPPTEGPKPESAIMQAVRSMRLHPGVDWTDPTAFTLQSNPLLLAFRDPAVELEFLRFLARQNVASLTGICAMFFAITIYFLAVRDNSAGFVAVFVIAFMVVLGGLTNVAYLRFCRTGAVFSSIGELCWSAWSLDVTSAIIYAAMNAVMAVAAHSEHIACVHQQRFEPLVVADQGHYLRRCGDVISPYAVASFSLTLVLHRPRLRLMMPAALFGFLVFVVAWILSTGSSEGVSKGLFLIFVHFASMLAATFLKYIQERFQRRQFRRFTQTIARLKAVQARNTALRASIDHLIAPPIRKQLLQSTWSLHAAPLTTVLAVDIANTGILFPSEVPLRNVRVFDPRADGPDLQIACVSPIEALSVIMGVETILTRLSSSHGFIRVCVFGDMFCCASHLPGDGPVAAGAASVNRPPPPNRPDNARAPVEQHSAARGLLLALSAVREVEALHLCGGIALRAGVQTGLAIGTAVGGRHIHYALFGQALRTALSLLAMGAPGQVLTTDFNIGLALATAQVKRQETGRRVCALTGRESRAMHPALPSLAASGMSVSEPPDFAVCEVLAVEIASLSHAYALSAAAVPPPVLRRDVSQQLPEVQRVATFHPTSLRGFSPSAREASVSLQSSASSDAARRQFAAFYGSRAKRRATRTNASDDQPSPIADRYPLLTVGTTDALVSDGILSPPDSAFEQLPDVRMDQLEQEGDDEAGRSLNPLSLNGSTTGSNGVSHREELIALPTAVAVPNPLEDAVLPPQRPPKGILARQSAFGAQAARPGESQARGQPFNTGGDVIIGHLATSGSRQDGSRNSSSEEPLHILVLRPEEQLQKTIDGVLEDLATQRFPRGRSGTLSRTCGSWAIFERFAAPHVEEEFIRVSKRKGTLPNITIVVFIIIFGFTILVSAALSGRPLEAVLFTNVLVLEVVCALELLVLLMYRNSGRSVLRVVCAWGFAAVLADCCYVASLSAPSAIGSDTTFAFMTLSVMSLSAPWIARWQLPAWSAVSAVTAFSQVFNSGMLRWSTALFAAVWPLYSVFVMAWMERGERVVFRDMRIASAASELVDQSEGLRGAIVRACIPPPLQRRYDAAMHGTAQRHSEEPKGAWPQNPAQRAHRGLQVEALHAAAFQTVHPHATVVVLRLDRFSGAVEDTVRGLFSRRRERSFSSSNTHSAESIGDIMGQGIRNVERALRIAQRADAEGRSEATIPADDDPPLSITRMFGDHLILAGPLGDLHADTGADVARGRGVAVLAFLKAITDLEGRPHFSAALAQGTVCCSMTRGAYPTCEVVGAPVYVARSLLQSIDRGVVIAAAELADGLAGELAALPPTERCPCSQVVARTVTFSDVGTTRLRTIGRVRTRFLFFSASAPPAPTPRSAQTPATM